MLLSCHCLRSFRQKKQSSKDMRLVRVERKKFLIQLSSVTNKQHDVSQALSALSCLRSFQEVGCTGISADTLKLPKNTFWISKQTKQRFTCAPLEIYPHRVQVNPPLKLHSRLIAGSLDYAYFQCLKAATVSLPRKHNEGELLVQPIFYFRVYTPAGGKLCTAVARTTLSSLVRKSSDILSSFKV